MLARSRGLPAGTVVEIGRGHRVEHREVCLGPVAFDAVCDEGFARDEQCYGVSPGLYLANTIRQPHEAGQACPRPENKPLSQSIDEHGPSSICFLAFVL